MRNVATTAMGSVATVAAAKTRASNLPKVGVRARMGLTSSHAAESGDHARYRERRDGSPRTGQPFLAKMEGSFENESRKHDGEEEVAGQRGAWLDGQGKATLLLLRSSLHACPMPSPECLQDCGGIAGSRAELC